MYVKRLAQCLAHSRRSINLSFPLSNLGISFLSPAQSLPCVSPQDSTVSSRLVGRWWGGTPFFDGNSLRSPITPSRTFLPCPPPHPRWLFPVPRRTPPTPPFRARAESAWVNLAANSAGAGASPRLSPRVLASRLCPHPYRVTPTPALRSEPSPILKPFIILVFSYLDVTPDQYRSERGRREQKFGRSLGWTLCWGRLTLVQCVCVYVGMSLWASEPEGTSVIKITLESSSQNLPGTHNVEFQSS